MPFVWIGLILVLCKWLEFGPVATWSWWWVCAPLFIAFAWFEIFERVFGFDRRKAEHADFERIRKERIAKTFERDAKRR
jgi:small Trp-rich protein